MLPPEIMRAAYGAIKEAYGIELTWSEKAALSHYISCLQARWKREKEETGEASFMPYEDGIDLFMQEYFGMPTRELGLDMVLTNEYGKLCWKKRGLEFLGDERFKEYCKRYVDLWREERTKP